jgi:hypothetical protein
MSEWRGSPLVQEEKYQEKTSAIREDDNYLTARQ